MFNEYIDRSKQCSSYYNIVRKDEITLQQNDTVRFKSKWLDVSTPISNSNSNLNSNSTSAITTTTPSITTNTVINNTNNLNTMPPPGSTQLTYGINGTNTNNYGTKPTQQTYNYQQAKPLYAQNNHLNNNNSNSNNNTSYQQQQQQSQHRSTPPQSEHLNNNYNSNQRPTISTSPLVQNGTTTSTPLSNNFV
jgi:hypothetical protein